MMLAVRVIIETAYYIIFCDIIKCAVFLLIMKLENIITGKILTFYIVLLICSNLNLTARFYKHLNV